MRWMQTHKIPLQIPLFFDRVFYYEYNKGSKCTHTQFPYKISPLLKSPITTFKKANIHTKCHKTWTHPHIKPLKPKRKGSKYT